MEILTERLILRAWTEDDAESLYKYAKDPKVGPIAGWPVHTSVDNSKEIIENVLAVPETYAVCLKENNQAIGSIGLMIGKTSNLDILDTEGEIGYWIGVPFWGRGLIPEAVKSMLQHGFNELKLNKIWCGYFDGNIKSKRVQEKCGFTYHHTNKDIHWALMKDIRTEHITCLTRDAWKMNYRQEAVKCVKQYVLPEMKRQFKECGCSLDEQYKKYGDTEYFFANIIEPGHVYEIGYPRCVCMKPQAEKDADSNFCECSRQSIMYVYENLIPDKKVSVETIETALTGGSKCRFRVIVE